jgi:hypothetical protein
VARCFEVSEADAFHWPDSNRDGGDVDRFGSRLRGVRLSLATPLPVSTATGDIVYMTASQPVTASPTRNRNSAVPARPPAAGGAILADRSHRAKPIEIIRRKGSGGSPSWRTAGGTRTLSRRGRPAENAADASLSGPCASTVQVLQSVSVHYPRHGGRTRGDIGRANESAAGTGAGAPRTSADQDQQARAISLFITDLLAASIGQGNGVTTCDAVSVTVPPLL